MNKKKLKIFEVQAMQVGFAYYSVAAESLEEACRKVNGNEVEETYSEVDYEQIINVDERQ